jgi:hypothetical protein
MSEMAILQQLRGVAHNSRVTDANPDPPDTFSTAEEKFRTFLAAQDYPTTICWLMPGDMVVDTNRHYGVRKHERGTGEDCPRLHWLSDRAYPISFAWQTLRFDHKHGAAVARRRRFGNRAVGKRGIPTRDSQGDGNWADS